MLSLQNRITVNSLSDLGFSIRHSFLTDGTIEKFNLGTQTDYTDYISGSGKKFTIPFAVKKTRNGSNDPIISQWGATVPDRGFTLFFQSDNTIKFSTINSAGTALSAFTTTAFTSLVDWYVGMIVYDSSLTVGNRTKIYINNVDVPLDSDTNDSTIQLSTRIVELSRLNTLYGALHINQIGLINKACSFAEYQTWYNNGKPLSMRDLFTTDCKDFFNPDDSGDTAQFTVTDGVNPATWQSFNLEDVDKELLGPY